MTPMRATPKKVTSASHTSDEPDPPQPYHRFDVGERQAGGDDDGGERARREVGQEAGQRHQHHADQERPDDPGELRLRPGRLGHGRP